jgi:hypothetical protein
MTTTSRTRTETTGMRRFGGLVSFTPLSIAARAGEIRTIRPP